MLSAFFLLILRESIHVLEGIPMAEKVTVDDLLEMEWYHRGEVIKLDIKPFSEKM